MSFNNNMTADKSTDPYFTAMFWRVWYNNVCDYVLNLRFELY